MLSKILLLKNFFSVGYFEQERKHVLSTVGGVKSPFMMVSPFASSSTYFFKDKHTLNAGTPCITWKFFWTVMPVQNLFRTKYFEMKFKRTKKANYGNLFVLVAFFHLLSFFVGGRMLVVDR